jgi:hypothetical protein
MFQIALLLVAVWSAVETAGGGPSFDADFLADTMRVDYFHSGDASQEHISLDRVVLDGPWAGSRTRLLDDLNLGKYLFEVIDRATNRVVYSRGFASVYGEWETTGEARKLWRTFHESLRFPWPRRPVQGVLKKRDRDGLFRELWSAVVEPDSRFVTRAAVEPRTRPWTVLDNGPSAEKVDVVFLGDGYAQAEQEKFRVDVTRLTEVLFRHEPLRRRKADFNVRAVPVVSAQSGVSRPHAGVFRRPPLSTHYSSFDLERYVLTYDNRTLRDTASAVPYEFLVILVNERTYGGGGIFNLYATAAADSAYVDYVLVHEWGHHFAGLGDEYYTSDVAYETGAAYHPEPWEPNVTALHAPALLKWRDLLTPDMPLPTPWPKEEFEKLAAGFQEERRKLRMSGASEEKVEQHFREQKAAEQRLFAGVPYADGVGAFEGASYETKGLYRPTLDCIMFSRNQTRFCPVCRRAIERTIDLYTRP